MEGWRVICALKSGSSVHTDPVHLYTHIGFICTHIPGSSVHTELSGDGVGWGGLITFMFLCTHTDTANLIIFLLSSRRRHLSGDGVGWGDNVHVPVHTQAHPTWSSFLLSCKHRHYSWLISYRWGGVGWGNNVHVPVHTQAYQPSWLISYRWGGVGWGNNVHVPVHTQAHPTWSSFLLSSRHRHYSWLIYRFLSWNLTPPDFLVCCL